MAVDAVFCEPVSRNFPWKQANNREKSQFWRFLNQSLAVRGRYFNGLLGNSLNSGTGNLNRRNREACCAEQAIPWTEHASEKAEQKNLMQIPQAIVSVLTGFRY